jgi:hypothetical protein
MNLIVPCGQETLPADKSTSIPTSVTSGSWKMEELCVQTIRWNDITSISLERVVTIDHCHLQSADSVYANHIE